MGRKDYNKGMEAGARPFEDEFRQEQKRNQEWKQTFEEKFDNIKETNEAILDEMDSMQKKQFFKDNTVADISILEKGDRETLLALLFTLTETEENVNKYQQYFIRSVKKYLEKPGDERKPEKWAPLKDGDWSIIETIISIDETKAIAQAVMEFLFLGYKSHEAYEEAYEDLEFLDQIYPRMCTLMEFCEGQLDEQGFLIGRKDDWIFIDWADLDKEGPLCAEQMLFAECYHTMAGVSRKLGMEAARCEEYQKKYEDLIKKINLFYWDNDKGAYIDSFVSGKRHVARHANIFAVLFDIADERQKKQIVANVLLNEQIPRITTPYFKFYEMDALYRMGYLEEVLARVREYWGGMLERGAVTFWEEYDPAVPEEEQYDMYGDRFGKSLCHAWSASPIYLLSRYFIGLEVTDPVHGKYELHPHLEFFESLDCTLPVGEKDIHILWDGRELKVEEK